MKVTKEQFQAYEDVRESGVTNMYDTTYVSALSGLTKEEIKDIMTNYSDLCKEYPEVRDSS